MRDLGRDERLKLRLATNELIAQQCLLASVRGFDILGAIERAK